MEPQVEEFGTTIGIPAFKQNDLIMLE